MVPIIFDNNFGLEPSGAGMGLGSLPDAIRCEVTRERNGAFELAMEYPLDGLNADKITIHRIVVAAVRNGDTSGQPFDIYRVEMQRDKMTVYAQHVVYRLAQIPVVPTTPIGGMSPRAAIGVILSSVAESVGPWTITADGSASGYYSQREPASLKSCLVGRRGSIVDIFGGTLIPNWASVTWYQTYGEDSHIWLYDDADYKNLKITATMEDQATGCCPYWYDAQTDTLVTLPEKVVHSPLTQHYPMTDVVDYSQAFQTQPTESQLREEAAIYAAQRQTSKMMIRLDFTPEEPRYNTDHTALMHLDLCDTVHVRLSRFNLSIDATVIKTVYDALAERYTSVVLNDISRSFTAAIMDLVSDGIANNNRR